MEFTREGNEVATKNCALRIGMRETANSICADCAHVLDLCEKVGKRTEKTEDGYTRVISCNGFDAAP